MRFIQFMVTITALVTLTVSTALAAQQLPAVTADELAQQVHASEQAIRSFRCRATVTMLRDEEDWRDEYLSAPSRIAFDASPLILHHDWAFVGAPHVGKLRWTVEGTDRVIVDKDKDGHYEWDGHYAQTKEGVVFDGECQTTLSAGVGGVSLTPPSPELPPPGPDAHYSGVARIRPDRRWEDEYANLLQAHTFWLARRPLSECLKDGTAELVGVETVDGVPAYRVDVSIPDMAPGLVSVWLDPERGFSIVRRRGINPYNDRLWDETLAIELVEWSPTIWFPREIVRADPLSKELYRVVVKDVSVNEPLEPDLFTLDIPPGVRVYDKVKGGTYVAGWQERELENLTAAKFEDAVEQINKDAAEPAPATEPPESAEPAAPRVRAAEAKATAQPQRQEQAGTDPGFWVAGAIGVLGVIAAALYLRRRRAVGTDECP